MVEIKAKDKSGAFTVGMVVSQFNPEITGPLYRGALDRLKELQIPSEMQTTVWVPGAIEIPIVAERLARAGRYDVIIVLGAVIHGETPHFDYVCRQVSDGCLQVSLNNDLPVIFGVLTTDDEEQARARVGGEHGHKGRESVDAAAQMVSVLRQLDQMAW